MLDMPNWIISSLRKEKVDCRKCGFVFNSGSIKAIGIREAYQRGKKETLFVELFCQKCKDEIFFEIREMGLIDFAIDILTNKDKEGDEYEQEQFDFQQDPKIEDLMSRVEKSQRKKMDKKPGRSNSKSKITLKEIKDHAKFLDTLKTNDEFLQALGMSPEEIKKYEYNKKKESNE
ncbi:hypothetical protein LCGC14_1521940 [marine sediment metagenome]|uniref:Uncharacterized protein n=1 Tax=marine sediment metagenome TaxID=412755 RepID=A0A0F9IYL7_9ZZZZ